MPTISYSFAAEFVDSQGARHPIGDASAVKTIVGGNGWHDGEYFIVAAGQFEALRIGTSAGDDLPTFSFLVIYSDQDASIEIQGTVAANNSNVNLRAGSYFILTADDTRVYDAAGNFAGAAELIKKISVKNLSGVTAKIRIFAVE